MQAAGSGQRDAIKALLDENITLVGDGGGKVPSFHGRVGGADFVADLYAGMLAKHDGQIVYRMAMVNGQPGFLRYVEGRLESAQNLAVEGERIVGIYAVRNPDKLVGLPQAI